MINSGAESSRLPQRGAPLIRPKPFPLPKHPPSLNPMQQGRGLLSPVAKLWMGSGCPRSRRGQAGVASPSPGFLSPSHPCCKGSRCLLRSWASPAADPWVCRWDCPPKTPGMFSGGDTSPPGLGLTPAPGNVGVHMRALGRCRAYSRCPQCSISTDHPPCSHLRAAQGYTP